MLAALVASLAVGASASFVAPIHGNHFGQVTASNGIKYTLGAPVLTKAVNVYHLPCVWDSYHVSWQLSSGKRIYYAQGGII
eukprot:jgi/Hompol1/3442/HPOL_006565-RA